MNSPDSYRTKNSPEESTKYTLHTTHWQLVTYYNTLCAVWNISNSKQHMKRDGKINVNEQYPKSSNNIISSIPEGSWELCHGPHDTGGNTYLWKNASMYSDLGGRIRRLVSTESVLLGTREQVRRSTWIILSCVPR